jgi:ribonucleotide reductase alpha subunit
MWYNIRSLDTQFYEGEVYDFNMEDEHNYVVANLGIVHNSGRRNGSIAVYLEPHHVDIESFLMLRRNTGIESERARDLFYALWISDLFMKRIEEDGDWSLMCPDTCKGLNTTFGDEFERLYTSYEADPAKIRKRIKARKLWEMIMDSQIETGTPYILYKDAVNRKNNQANLGVIQSSNLCAEILEYTSPDEIAVCNLASIILPKFVEKVADKMEFNYERLREVVKMVTRNLNKVIDYNYYPVIEAERSNRRHRPIGIGIQGLADVFALMKLPFDSAEAAVVNRKIAENMYFAACESSMELARKRKKHVQEYRRLLKNDARTEEETAHMETLKMENFIIEEEVSKLPMQYAGAYSSFMGSPAQEGKLQFDLWAVEPSAELDWASLKSDISKHGMRNSLLMALMPTASTSQINGSNECFEPFTNNIYTRRTLAGSFVIINKYLVADLIELGIWTPELKDKIILADGSIQNIDEIPLHIKNMYRTVWEMKQRSIIDLAVGRAPFVDQTQSMNLWVKDPSYKILSSMHFYSWKQGLKTGIYYLRSMAKTAAQKFSVDIEKALDFSKTLKAEVVASEPKKVASTAVNPPVAIVEQTALVATRDEEEQAGTCMMCSS